MGGVTLGMGDELRYWFWRKQVRFGLKQLLRRHQSAPTRRKG
jgi:hypothetical protein